MDRDKVMDRRRDTDMHKNGNRGRDRDMMGIGV